MTSLFVQIQFSYTSKHLNTKILDSGLHFFHVKNDVYMMQACFKEIKKMLDQCILFL
jgi:hypothetical protein